MAPAPESDTLALLRAELKGIQRRVRIAVQLAARADEEAQQSKETHERHQKPSR
jgi:hypothetical protein